MIKLALIDNGIPYHMRNNRNQRIVHKSFLASKCDPSEYKDDKSFHGAVCVGIITSICSDIELWDLEYYDDSNESLNDILYTVYIAYEPDIILLNQEEEIFESSKASDIDMYIVRKNNMYELYAEDRIGITYNIEDIYELVCQYFA